LPGTVAGTVSSLIVGPFENALVSSAMGRDVRTSPDGSYSLALPAGEHQLSVSEVPIGCGSSTRNVLVSSSSTTVVNFSVDCTTVTHLAVGALHGCALAATGAAQCWGGNEYGMVGDGTSVSPRLLPVAVTGSVAFQAGSLSSGYTHTCGIRNSRAVCWGLNFFAALGVGTAGLFASEPVAVGTSATPSFTAVSAGGYHGCGLTSAGTAWCWGWNQEGQAGQSSTAPQLLPAAVNAGPLVFAQIAAGESHTCALTTAGAAYCWGGNGRGELGSDPAVVGTSSVVPIAVPGDHVFASIDAGTFHTCGITTVGALLCWGSQEHGQLGNGVVDAGISAPTAVSGGATYRQVSAGGHSTCAVTTADVVHCWGAGVSGVLGNGTNVATQSTPVPVVGALSVAGVAVNLSDPSGATACAFTLTGAAYCWGQGSNGQFGVGTTTSSNVPVQVLIRGPQP
jgi:alpha-tubulin suppressor-like RCC1 family protein